MADTKGCRKRLAAGQYWTFCGETDMGQTAPALCKECGGPFELDANADIEKDDFLESQEFYEAMQRYRHAPREQQREVVACFEAVKRAIRESKSADAAEMKRLADALEGLPDDEYLVAWNGNDNGLASVKEAAALLRRMAGETK